ncbi:hypothetical protein DWX08_10545 [Ruminococcus sp. AF18-22]|nr:hypothetical protein DWX08_10545 [Ruminococcus sp. AF18-22]
MKTKELISSLTGLFELAKKVDHFQKKHKEHVTEKYEKLLPVDGGTVSVCVQYNNVPPTKLNESFNLINQCFTDFYQEFFEKISSEKITN